MKDSIEKQNDVALEEMTTPTTKEAQQRKAKILDKQEQLCEISKALAVLASASVRILWSVFKYLLCPINILTCFCFLSFSL